MVRVTIKLVDAWSKAAIPWTPIFINMHGSTSGADGVAIFDVPAGQYTLKVRSPLYGPVTQTVSAPGDFTIELARVKL